MKKGVKNGILIGAACVGCYLVGAIVGWPVDEDSTKGDISKAGRYNKAVVTEDVKAVQEFLQSDPEYRDESLYAFMIMNSRVNEFIELAQLSVSVADGKEEYADVVEALKTALPVALNARKSFEMAAADLNTLLDGTTLVASYEQNSNNAMLAYMMLQNHNAACEQFVGITDYLAKSDDLNLLFVRDAWVGYNLVSAMLADDEDDAYEWSRAGSRLTEEQTAQVMGELGIEQQNYLQVAHLAGASVMGNWAPGHIDMTALAEVLGNQMNVGSKMDLPVMAANDTKLMGAAAKDNDINLCGAQKLPQLESCIANCTPMTIGMVNAQMLESVAQAMVGANADIKSLGIDAAKLEAAEGITKLGQSARKVYLGAAMPSAMVSNVTSIVGTSVGQYAKIFSNNGAAKEMVGDQTKIGNQSDFSLSNKLPSTMMGAKCDVRQYPGTPMVYSQPSAGDNRMRRPAGLKQAFMVGSNFAIGSEYKLSMKETEFGSGAKVMMGANEQLKPNL